MVASTFSTQNWAAGQLGFCTEPALTLCLKWSTNFWFTGLLNSKTTNTSARLFLCGFFFNSLAGKTLGSVRGQQRSCGEKFSGTSCLVFDEKACMSDIEENIGDESALSPC